MADEIQIGKRGKFEFMLDYFRVAEPITRSVGTTRKEAEQLYADLVDSGLKMAPPVSFLAFEESSGRLIGCRLNEIVEIAAPPGEKAVKHENCDIPASTTVYSHENARKIADFIDDLSADLYQLLPSSRKMMKFVVVGVHPDFMRNGIGSKLVGMSLELARNLNCDCITTTATALKSQKMFEKLGFETIHELQYAEYRKNGEIVFKHLHDGATSGKLMVKKL